MPSASVTNSKTVTKDLAPHLSAAALTALLALPVEQLTVGQLRALVDATKRVQGGHAPGAVLGALFT